MKIDLGTPIKSLLESSPLNQLSEDDKMIVAGRMGATLQMLIQPIADARNKAMNLLDRAVRTEMRDPDKTWFHEYFALTGEWMILTDEGWEPGGEREAYLPGEILDEVNAPEDEREDLESYSEFMQAMHAEAPTEKHREYFRGQAGYAESRLRKLANDDSSGE